jgi:hypothetical protein
MICSELTPTLTSSDHNSGTIRRMRVHLYFLERSHNYISLSYWVLFCIMYQSQSVEFYEIIISENRI